MKHLKTYENIKNIPKTGDIVKCIDDDKTTLLTKNKLYTISGIIYGDINYYKLEELLKTDGDHNYQSRRFIMATTEEIASIKYNI